LIHGESGTKTKFVLWYLAAEENEVSDWDIEVSRELDEDFCIRVVSHLLDNEVDKVGVQLRNFDAGFEFGLVKGQELAADLAANLSEAEEGALEVGPVVGVCR
jgi:hypothetical protein